MHTWDLVWLDDFLIFIKEMLKICVSAPVSQTEKYRVQAKEIRLVGGGNVSHQLHARPYYGLLQFPYFNVEGQKLRWLDLHELWNWLLKEFRLKIRVWTQIDKRLHYWYSPTPKLSCDLLVGYKVNLVYLPAFFKKWSGVE